jgi:cytochrome P450
MKTARISQSPTDAGFVQNPYATYRRFREHDAIWWEDYGMWVFPGFDDVNAIFRDRRFGRDILHVSTREALGWEPVPQHLEPFYAFEANSLLEKEPPAHTRLRALVNRAFVSRRIEALRPRIWDLAERLAADLRPGDDLIAKYCEPIPVTIITELLGVPADVGPQLLDWSHRMVAMYQARRDRQIEDEASAATIAFTDYITGWIEQRRGQPGVDLLSALIAAEEAGERLSTDELVATAILLLNAGHEATVHAIGNGIVALAATGSGNQPLGPIAEEVMRYDPPLHMFTRYVLEDLNWNGLDLRMGEQVGLLIGSANRDERITPNPDRFDPSRAQSRHVALGGGIHFCVGAPLARLELQTALEVLFRSRKVKFDPSTLRYRDAYHFHGFERLILVD